MGWGGVGGWLAKVLKSAVEDTVTRRGPVLVNEWLECEGEGVSKRCDGEEMRSYENGGAQLLLRL